MQPIVVKVRRFVGKQKAIAAALTTVLGTIGAALTSVIVTGNVDWTETRIALGGLALAGFNYLAVFITSSPEAEIDRTEARRVFTEVEVTTGPNITGTDKVSTPRGRPSFMRARVAACLVALATVAGVLSIAPSAFAWPDQFVTGNCCPPGASPDEVAWSPLSKLDAERWVARAFANWDNNVNGPYDGVSPIPSAIQNSTAITLGLPPNYMGFPGRICTQFVGSGNTGRYSDGSVQAFVYIYKQNCTGYGGNAYCTFTARVGRAGGSPTGNIGLWNSSITYAGGSPSTACFYY